MKDYNNIPHTQNVDKLEVINEKPALKPIINAKPVKRSLSSRVAGYIFGPNGLRGVLSSITKDILLPTAKQTFVDAVSTSAKRVVFGNDAVIAPSNTIRRTYTGNNTRVVDYNSIYSKTPTTISTRSSRTISDYELSEQDAYKIVNTLRVHLLTYKQVTVADYYDLIGASTSMTDHDYGWTDLSSVTLSRLSNGNVYINFPTVEVL